MVWPTSSFVMLTSPFTLVSLAVCVSILLYLFHLRRSDQQHVRRFLSLQQPRTTTALESSPEKPAQRTEPSYVDVFPPTQRGTLDKIVSKLPEAQKQAMGGHLPFDEAAFQRALLGLNENYETAAPNKYCFSGFSMAEIRALGDFPDYAELSGVPAPAPYKQFNIETALPRPYRPFRWSYHQTMSLMKMEPDFWIELENSYKERIAERQNLYARHGGDVLQHLPGSELACKELMEMVLQFLCARYPQYFTLSADKTVLENGILQTTTDLKRTPPLITLLNNVPEDFAIMLRNPADGYYYLRAGIICSAVGWNLGLKIGKSLPEIHIPVPDYKEKMQMSMDRFFTKMPTTKPIQRGSWFFEIDQPLYMPPNDPREKRLGFQDPRLEPENIHLRVDWQTLRRLPLSGGVVFNFKALFTPITEFRNEPYIPSLTLKLLNESKAGLLKYKHTWHIEHIVKPLMARYEKEQFETGVIPRDWVHHTLDESPFFPGWEDKWRLQQGF